MSAPKVRKPNSWAVTLGASALALGAAIGPAGATDIYLRGQFSDDLADALKAGSLLVEQQAQESEVLPLEVLSAAQADYKRLLAVLYDNGYFAPVISIRVDGREAADIPLIRSPGAVRQIDISIDKGRKFTFGRANIAPIISDTEIPDGFRSGETARISVMKDAVGSGIERWREEGYAKARLAREQITANHGQARVDADLTLDPGRKLRFGALTITGNRAVRTERISEIAELPVGETYSPEELDDAAARLRRTGAFSAVAFIEAETPNPDGTLPMTLQVTEEKPRRFGFGAEVATTEGVSLSAYWLHRNLLGGAESLRFDAEVTGIGGDTGGTDYLLSVLFKRPATFNEDTNFFAGAAIERLDEPNYFSETYEVVAGFERIADDNRSYRLAAGFRHAETEDAFGKRDYTLFLVPAGLTFDYRDRELDARSGYYANVDATPFAAIKGADNGMLTEADVRWYRSFGTDDRTTFAFRAQLGSLVGPDLDEAPADFLFYAGGSDTVRGHPYESLGVELDNGDTVGGRSFLGLSAEMRFRTQGNLGYVAFADAGYIGAEEFPDGSGEWQTGAGLGLRYDTTIGPIRLDVAVPTSGRNKGDNIEVYIGIGQAF
ncbi:autotransporter assembly complex family protein [Sulfitobacter sp. D35]|uniref:autotransporter assembly complex protein TamA n=1 Tax=Sulfitobacter sp. D35 TaxID=3083252 RepID=UPI00296E6AA7|nr:autotransporter assembly complex family protein [Sulfitobacter sp. D35]MDW4496426.1 autotransporter assembly complex family protein [Sulfitobacter sp. D35]